jgi:hypothetical protein
MLKFLVANQLKIAFLQTDLSDPQTLRNLNADCKKMQRGRKILLVSLKQFLVSDWVMPRISQPVSLPTVNSSLVTVTLTGKKR